MKNTIIEAFSLLFIAGIAYAALTITPTYQTRLTMTKKISFTPGSNAGAIRFKPTGAIGYRFSQFSSSYYPVAANATEELGLSATGRQGIIFNMASSATKIYVDVQVER